MRVLTSRKSASRRSRKSPLHFTGAGPGLKSSAENLGKRVVSVNRLLVDLESEIDFTRNETIRQEIDLVLTEEELAFFRNAYMIERSRVEELRMENVLKRGELFVKENLRDTFAREVHGLDEDVVNFEQAIEVLTREVEKTKNIQNALASKAEEVALLQVSVENTSRTGTNILYDARANPPKVGSAQGKIVLACMIGAFLVCGFLVCSAKIIRATS